jgi:hypothetical protein
VSSAVPQESQRVGYDGHWWLSISHRERGGFVAGYVDCYAYEYKGPEDFSNRPLESYTALITQYYRRDPGALAENVPSALYRFRDRPTDVVSDTGTVAMQGEAAFFEPHGFFDGQYWREITSPGRLGFVEGYLLCHATQSRNEGGAFSKSPDAYRTLITNWYGLNEQTDEMNADRAREKIADVLFGFRDRAK